MFRIVIVKNEYEMSPLEDSEIVNIHLKVVSVASG